MSTNSTESAVEKQELVKRMLVTQTEILDAIRPARQYMDFIVQFFPHRNNDEDKKTIRAMWSYRTFDLEILEELEQLPELIKKS